MSNSLWPHGLYSPWNSPGQNTGVGSLFLFQEIFPTQGSNPGPPHGRWILHQISYKGSPRILEWVAYPFSRGSSQPRNWTRVSSIAGGFFTNWNHGSPQRTKPTAIIDRTSKLKILLEEEMATHSSILAWRIPWTEEPCGLQSTGSQKSQTWLSEHSAASSNRFYKSVIRVWNDHTSLWESLLKPHSSLILCMGTELLVQGLGIVAYPQGWKDTTLSFMSWAIRALIISGHSNWNSHVRIPLCPHCLGN